MIVKLYTVCAAGRAIIMYKTDSTSSLPKHGIEEHALSSQSYLGIMRARRVLFGAMLRLGPEVVSGILAVILGTVIRSVEVRSYLRGAEGEVVWSVGCVLDAVVTMSSACPTTHPFEVVIHIRQPAG